MKKKLLSLILAAVMAMPLTVFAENTAIKDMGNERAVLICYDGGKLVYSSLLKSENGAFDVEIPDEYKDTDKKVYYVGSNTIGDFDDAEKVTPEETTAPSASPSPEPTPSASPEPSPSPAASAKPTAAPETNETPYEKAADGVFASALVTNVARSINSDDEEITSLTVYYQGNEVVLPVEDDVKISTAPKAHADLAGQTAASLKKGDVICTSANIAGTRIKTLDLIMRPTKEDIVTSNSDYGDNFEDLFVSGALVANKWQYEKYGAKQSNAKYSYAFGIVGTANDRVLTLLNNSGGRYRAMEIDLDKNTYVYSCDTSGKDYDFYLGGIYDIETTLPSSLLRDRITLDDSYSYNYALVRMVEGTATDIVTFNNYNY